MYKSIVEDANKMIEEANLNGGVDRRVSFNRLINKAKPKSSLKSKSGVLEKFSPTIMVGWQPRYIELKNRLLLWKKHGDTKVQGSINFDLYWCTVQQNPEKL